eukprot:CAMPEP_0119107974 /NCGR_PEP_ID=MMETSP1180-20130426/12705_1 /TAXON_ID=3052 ORGANISM="Chlamydomonas cf sp, Strain CCMP681" /NCGR_SAMPLE_ID=MMETSP1180 /ASSEMBLY_ACC=CAM_ASM_000741 /LENGTH=173 /DNA_ID=CAMNT_0007093529 /DNA_START=222 /DNA_END=740 /DNA_ORIENTATION=-
MASLRFFSRLPEELKQTPRRILTASRLASTVLAPGSLDAGAFNASPVRFEGVHHVALLCSNLETSLQFFQGVLGLEINLDRPDAKLPYRGAWLWIGPEMIHLMELPNPDPVDNRPEHGGRDRHFCLGVQDIKPLVERLEAANITFTKSMSGRPAIFFRDPDMNCLEVVEQGTW